MNNSLSLWAIARFNLIKEEIDNYDDVSKKLKEIENERRTEEDSSTEKRATRKTKRPKLSRRNSE